MIRTRAVALTVAGLLLAVGWFVAERALDPERRSAVVESHDPGALGAPNRAADGVGSGVVAGPVAAVEPDRTPAPAARVGQQAVYTPEDVRIFEAVMDEARRDRLDTLALGDIIVRVGRRFVGDPYTPHTLDIPGDERVIINLREFDCVTFVESTLALARMIRDGRSDFEALPAEIERIRYRDGRLDGYASRLHYFSEWIADNADRGVVEPITPAPSGTPDSEPISFMSRHAEAYPQLDGFPERVERIRAIEARLSQRPRVYIPEAEIGAAAAGIRDGDVIAATSAVEGLDIAHTGFAVWQDGALHLMHAPLVGRVLEISEEPLATRVLRIDGQDGIMVARPR
jgi:hypothetical protein